MLATSHLMQKFVLSHQLIVIFQRIVMNTSITPSIIYAIFIISSCGQSHDDYACFLNAVVLFVLSAISSFVAFCWIFY
jgi:hypothetical protein